MKKLKFLSLVFVVLILSGCTSSKEVSYPDEQIVHDEVDSEVEGGEVKMIEYENTEIGFKIEHLEDMKIEEQDHDGGKKINFSVWGPSQVSGTEFFDGLSVTIGKSDLSGVTLKGLVDQKVDELSTAGQITEEVKEFVWNDLVGYEFSGVSVGAPQRRIFLPIGNIAAFEIDIVMGDPTNFGFEKMAEEMIGTLELLDLPEKNIKVELPVAGDIIGEKLSVKGLARVFEATVNYRLTDEFGNVLVEDFVTANPEDAGEFGSFEIDVEYESTEANLGKLEVFNYSANDGSEIDKVIIPISF